MHAAASPLLEVLRAMPRRYRMPALPADAAGARAAGPETAIAFAMEQARRAGASSAVAPPGLETLFTAALADLIRGALSAHGDPSFQALVLRSDSAQVEEFVRLSAEATGGQRALRAAVNAVAHPGKLKAITDADLRDALSRLHALASTADWPGLEAAVAALLSWPAVQEPALQATLKSIAAHPALALLQRLDVLRELPVVQRYLDLCARLGPPAGSDAAAAHGRAAARAGDAAEDLSARALEEAARWLDRHEAPRRHRVVRGLRTPAGFPPGADKAKDEWDAAIVRPRGEACDLVLLAEVKASPAAATPDFARLLRGLQRLAGAEAGTRYAFASADGPVQLHGESLRGLQPPGFALPTHVIYCCAAEETRAPVLSAASRAVLLGEPASLAFARSVMVGSPVPSAGLEAVWTALADAPRLRSALHQYDTARAAREAMLHPQDLLAALRAAG